MNKQLIKGSALVALGAACYGVLATFVKMAYDHGFTTAEITTAQSLFGVIGLFLLNVFFRGKNEPQSVTNRKSVWMLVLCGTSMGLTSIFYYLSVKYIAVSIGIILLMQTVWMGVVLEAFLQKRFPSAIKIIAALVILVGTALAANLVNVNVVLDWRGVAFGILAAICYTITLYTTNSIALELPPLKRSLWILVGSLAIIVLVFFPSLLQKFAITSLWTWGLFLAVFGTILPPLLLTKGMPLTGMGWGTIIAAIEIPVSVLMAHWLLHEEISVAQWLGIVLILGSIVLMNLSALKIKRLQA
ncbi:DMT family transporter [Danxiaibacter flavus]|uniref:DMT family transporter n=1 Tax=Danxiaibacter flavus TaxID=3049108 RepID=A0ABV3ZEL8_9BACT|nr:DMT family transporter [Chitinophagaceae bacterium DXS]